MKKKIFFNTCYFILVALYLVGIFFYTEKETFVETYLMNVVVLLSLHLVMSLLFFYNFEQNSLTKNVYNVLKNPFFAGYLVLSSAFLSVSVIDKKWYETIIVHISFTLILLFVLEFLKMFIAKNYKKEYYILVCYLIAFVVILVKLFY